jgi:outer membrane protein OmpA-like peptidoglycan-associated protein
MKYITKLALVVTLAFGLMQTSRAQEDRLPPNPEPGKCYVKCVTPDEFETVGEKILVTPGYSRLEVVPATYETIEERVMVKEASKRYVYHPAEYETVEVPYVSKQGSDKINIVPANLSGSSQRIEVYPTHAGWEYSTYPDCASPNPLDCQVICWKEYPARFQTISTQVLVADASYNKVPVPEVGSTYKKQVIKKAAWTEEIPIEAEYTVIKKQVLKTPATVRTVNIEAVYSNVEKTRLVKKGGVTVWEEVDCELTQATVLPILWDFNSATLNAEAKRIVDESLMGLLNDKPNISIELLSHTDSRGNDEYNLALSQRRADAIKNYLISRGIKGSRIVSKGYGETRLKNRCSNGVECTEAQHQANRRTEFRVIGSN